MSSSTKPTGIIPPLTTPFTAEGRIHEKGLRQLLQFQVAGGVHGLFICGTYGSGPIMPEADRKRVCEIVIEEAGEKLTVVVHVGTTSTELTVELAKHAEGRGAACVAAIPPYYHKHDERSVVRHFEQLAAAVSIPVYVYNNPQTSGFDVGPGTLRRLADAGVAGIKDSGFSFIGFTHLILAMQDRPDFHFVVGTEGIALPAWMSGAKGCVSGLANAFPEVMVRFWDLYTNGKYDEAAELQLTVNRARQILHIPSSTNAAIYRVLHARGIDAGYPKAPILPVPDDHGAEMLAAFRDIGFLPREE